uniref:Uncharacterized protein n=1 Tax=Arundo donax TaxID=35708 RepID=A0A0A9EHM3_ARUDO
MGYGGAYQPPTADA